MIDISEFNEALPLFECLKLSISNALIEFDWITSFTKIYNAEDDQNNGLIKLSILRVILQCLRISKEFMEKCLNNKAFINLLQYSLYSDDHIISATAIQIYAQIVRFNFSNKK